MSKIQNNNLVAQSNKLIEARYKLTDKEQLLVSAMFSLISPNDEKIPPFSASIESLSEILNINKTTAKREFRKIAFRLLHRVFEAETVNGDWEAFQWVSYATVNGDHVYIQFHDRLAPYLLSLRKTGHFTQYRLGSITTLKGCYSIRIYQELKKNYSNKKYHFEYSLSDFRKMMFGITTEGYYVEKYPVFKDFRRRVLESAKKELSKKDKVTGLYKSDLNFDFETRRTGRKISHLMFTVKTQPTKPLLPKSERGKNKPNDDTAPQIIRDYEFFGLDRLVVQPFLKERGEQSLINTLERFKADKKDGKIKKNEQGYLRHLLKTEAGQRTKSEVADEKEKKQKLAEDAQQQEAEALEQRIADYKKAFGENERQRFIESLDADQLDDVKNRLLIEHRGIGFMLERIKKNDFLSPLLMKSLNAMIPDFEAQQEDYVRGRLEGL